jgi:hypothetical protein
VRIGSAQGDGPDGDENGGESLADMAGADLDAALQLLADRAQYITGASGAAIALRRGGHADMLCRASAGTNAPELGALLSADHGLSGECVRTAQALRCDDAENDPRVNHEVCRELGIASVVVMPIVSDGTVLGVFELFSGKAQAFGERDLSTLVRLSLLVETAVKHAAATQAMPGILEHSAAQNLWSENLPGNGFPRNGSRPHGQQREAAERQSAVGGGSREGSREDKAKSSLLWTSAMGVHSAARPGETPRPASSAAQGSSAFERNKLQKCQACGFPVSQDRTLCVECEEKKWRGLGVAEAAERPGPRPSDGRAPQSGGLAHHPSPIQFPTPAAPAEAIEARIRNGESRIGAAAIPATPAAAADSAVSPYPTLFLATVHSRSWLEENQYILAALLVVAAVSAMVWFGNADSLKEVARWAGKILPSANFSHQ